MSLSGIQSVSNTLTGNDIQDINLNSVTAVYGDFTNLSATSMSVLTMNTPGVINCGGLNSTGSITGLISASSINNSGNYSGSYLSLNNNTISLGLAASSINPGAANIAIGIAAGQNNQGQYSVGVGFGACQLNQGQYSVGIGYQSGKNLQGNNSVAVGNNSGSYNQGDYSTAIGVQAGYTLQGNYCTAIGYYAGHTNQTLGSIAIGSYSGYNIQDAYAVAIGYQAGQQAQGQNSISIGYQAGQNNQGQNSICIGANTISTGNSSIALGNNAISTGNNNISIGTTNETINLNGDTTCKSLISTSTQDYNINTPTLGSIISNGGINVAKNIYGQNFQTNNSTYLYGIISRTSGPTNMNINGLDVLYNEYNKSANISGNKIYTITCNSGFDRVINISTPIGMRLYTSVGRTGTTSTSYTFNLTITNLNLVINKNGSYYSTVPLTIYDPSVFDFTYQGTANGLQTVYFYIFISTGYTSFIPTPDTLNVTDTYDFYLTATLTYSAVGTLATFGTMSFQFYANTNSFVSQKSEYQCSVSLATGSGSHHENPTKVYCHTSFPYSTGTSITNVMNCNNIKMLSTGIITKETINSVFDSTYQSYLTVRDAGVYLYNSANGIFVPYPIYKTTLLYSNFFTSNPSTGNLNTYNVANGGGLGVGEFGNLNLANNDDVYLIYPEYGIQVYTGGNFGGTLVIDYYNSSSTINLVRAVTNNTGDSCKLYYRGVEITSY